MTMRAWQRRSIMLAVFYLLALAYVAIYPLHFVRAWWDFIWPRFPILPEQLFPGTTWLVSMSIIVAIPPALLLAAGWLGAGLRSERHFWLRALLLFVGLNAILLGIVVIQLLFWESLLPRLDPRGLPAGVLLGLLLWLLLGSKLRLLVAGLSGLLRGVGGLPAAVWQLRWLIALLGWCLWLLAGAWAWPVAAEMLAAQGAETGLWWLCFCLGLFGFSGFGKAVGSDAVARWSATRLLWTWLALSLVMLACLVFGDNWQSGRLRVSVDWRLAAQQGGFVVGLLAALALKAVMELPAVAPLRRYWPRCRNWLMGGAAALTIALTLLPLDPGMRLVDIAAARPPLSLHALVQQFYNLLKDAILWLPVGFIFALGQRQKLMWDWLTALCGGLLLLLLPWIAAWPLGLPVAIGAAWAGLLSGLWLARTSQPAVAGGALPVARAQAHTSEAVEHSGVADPGAQPPAAVMAEATRSRRTGSSQFRHREPADGVAASAGSGKAASSVWRRRAADGEATDTIRSPGFRARNTTPDGSSGDDKDGV